MNRLHGIFFQKNIYSSFESKICFLWKKLEKRKKEGKIVKLIYHFISQVFFFDMEV